MICLNGYAAARAARGYIAANSGMGTGLEK